MGQACRMQPAIHSYHTALSGTQGPCHRAREQAKTEMDIGDHRSNTLSRLSSQEIHGIRRSMWKWPDKPSRGGDRAGSPLAVRWSRDSMVGRGGERGEAVAYRALK